MVKRKRGESTPIWMFLTPIGVFYAILTVGMITLIGLSGWGVWRWSTMLHSTPQPTTPTPAAIIIYPSSIPVRPYPSPTVIVPTYTAPSIAFKGSLLFSSMDGRLGKLDDSTETFLNPVVQAEYVAASPNGAGTTIAYLHSGRLHLYSPDDGDRLVAIAGNAHSVTWSPDGESLALIVRSGSTDLLYQLSAKTLEPIYQLSVPQFAAPPAWHPSTRRLLLAEPVGQNKTILYTIDSYCASPASCQNSRQEFTTLDFNVNWLTYQPSGLYMVAAERDYGNLYLISTAKRDAQLLITDHTFKQNPIFSPDGSEIAYLDNAQHLFIADLSTMTASRVWLSNEGNFTASSISWSYR